MARNRSNLTNIAEQSVTEEPELTDIVESFRTLCDRTAEQHSIALLLEKSDGLQQQLDDSKSKQQEVEKNLSNLIAEHDQLRNTVVDKDEKIKIQDGKLRDATEVNKELFTQLHQVQEELEVTFLAKEKVDENLKIAQANIASLTTERDSLKNETATLNQANREQTTLTQREQSKVATLTSERDSLKNETATLAAANKEQETLTQQLQSKVSTLTAEKDKLQKIFADNDEKIKIQEGKLRDATEENELLLLQLHQVQEELEHYFLQYQEIKVQQEKSDARWQRMLKRQPDYCDYESLTCNIGEEKSTLVWDIQNLEISGRHFTRLQFETFILGGVNGFRFSRAVYDEAADGSPLLRWPYDSENDLQVSIIPVANSNEDVQKCASILNSLSTSDWQLLQTLSKVLSSCLRNDQLSGHISKTQRAHAIGGIDRCLEIIAQYPDVLRYDHVALYQEHREKGYEHLWLVVENLHYGPINAPTFEFRLSCANVRKTTFGSDPRLEFPSSASDCIFENWFEESSDQFGQKLELRFALPDAMDLDVWQKLSSNDASFIQALVRNLPMFLYDLRQADTKFERSWDDWIDLSKNITNILDLRTALVPQMEEK